MAAEPTLSMAILNAIVSTTSMIFTGVMAYFTASLNIKASAAEKINHDTHVLVNSNMGIQLKLASVLADRVAKLSRKKVDIAYAIEAKRLYDEHMAKQAIVDAGMAQTPPTPTIEQEVKP